MEGVDALSAQHKAVDVAHHFGDWHRSHHAHGLGLGHGTRHDAGQISTFKGLGVVHGCVVGRLVAGGVLELHILDVSGDLLHKVLIAEAGGEDQLVALTDHVAHHALGVCRLWHALDHGSLDLVAELLLDGLAAQLVLVGPAAVADGAHIHEADLELVGSRSSRRCGGRRCRSLFLLAASGQHSHGNSRQADHLDQSAFAQSCH